MAFYTSASFLDKQIEGKKGFPYLNYISDAHFATLFENLDYFRQVVQAPKQFYQIGNIIEHELLAQHKH